MSSSGSTCREMCDVCKVKDEIHDVLCKYDINDRAICKALDYTCCLGPLCRECDECDVNMTANNVCYDCSVQK